LHIICNMVQGLLFAVISFTSIDSGKNLKNLFKSCFCCCKNNKKLMEKPHDDLTNYLSNNDNRITIYSNENDMSNSEIKFNDSHKSKLLN